MAIFKQNYAIFQNFIIFKVALKKFNSLNFLNLILN